MTEIKWFVSADHVIRLYKRLANGTWSKHIAAVSVDHDTLMYNAYVTQDSGFIKCFNFDDVPSAKHWVHTVLRMTGCE